MWSPLWSTLVCKIPQFWEKLLICTTHHTFLKSRYLEVTKNPYYPFSPKVSQKKVLAHGLFLKLNSNIGFSRYKNPKHCDKDCIKHHLYGTQIKERKWKKYLNEENEKHSFGYKVFLFKKIVQESPFYICMVSNCCVYCRSVILYSEEKFPLLDQNPLKFFESYDGHFYICKTCSRKNKKGRTFCQDICNKL